MSISMMSKDMNDLVMEYVDSLEIDTDQAQKCLHLLENADMPPPGRSKDPLILMAYACMYYGCMRYPDALRNVRAAKKLFDRSDNPLHFDVLCVLEATILTALSRIPQAQECVHRHVRECEGDRRRRLQRLCIQTYRMSGRYEDAILMVDGLKSKATDEYQHAAIDLIEHLCDRDLDGDHQVFCSKISPVYWHLHNDARYEADARKLVVDYGSELAYSYAWQGRMDLSALVVSEIEPDRHAMNHISFLSASALSKSAHQEFDEALESVHEQQIRIPGVSFEDAFTVQVVRLIILHFAGYKREALTLSVRLSEYARTNPGLALSSTAHLLFVSVLMWFFDFTQASAMLRECTPSGTVSVNRAGEHATHACLNALVAARSHDEDQARSIIKDARASLSNPNASLVVAALCSAHPSLLGLIGSALEVDAIPSNITGLLDHARNFEAISTSSGMLSKEEGVILAQRFTRVDTGLKVRYEERRKPIMINLFGGLSLFSNDEPINLSGWSRSKAYQMLIRTVLEQGGDLPRDASIRLLWPDLEKCSAANNYYVTLSKLTHNLASRCASEDMSDIIVRSTSGRVRLNVEICDCDIIQFEAATISARKCVLERDFISAFQHYYRMIEIYRGDLLVGDHDYPWLELHRARFRKQFFDSMVAACTLCLEVGQPDETHFFIDAALRHELGREAFYEMSVRAYKAVGRREDALNAYYEYVEYLQEKLGLDPSPEFQALFNDLLTS